MKRLFLGFGLLLSVLAQSTSHALAADKIVVAVGGKTFINYLPITLGETLGYYKEAGIDVDIEDVNSGAKTVEDVVSGSVDIAIGGYENTLYLQRRGIDLRIISMLTNSPGLVIMLKPSLAKTYKSPADFKGLTMGVTALGTTTSAGLTTVLAKAGLPADAAGMVAIGNGAGALAAIKSGRVDGAVTGEPVVSQAINDGDMVPIVDTRKAEGRNYLYGGEIAGVSLLATADNIQAKKDALGRYVKAISRTLAWMQASTPEEIAAKVPEAYFGGNRALYLQSLTASKPMFSKDGSFTEAQATRNYQAFKGTGLFGENPNLDVSKTLYTGFAK